MSEAIHLESIRDKLWTPGDPPYEGRVQLELFNGRTGKKEEESVSKNYATDLYILLMKWAARALMGTAPYIPYSGSPTYFGGAYGSFETPPVSPPWGVALTSAAHAEDPTNDRFFGGTLSALASNTQAFPGVDTKRGTLNSVETVYTPTYSKLVFDWPTNSGNGTHRSVYWMGLATLDGSFTSPADWNLPSVHASTPILPGGQYGQVVLDVWTGLSNVTFQQPNGVILDVDGVTYWESVFPSGLVRRNLTTGAVVSSFDISGRGIGQIVSIGYDGTNFWVMGQAGVLGRVSAAGANVGATVPVNGWPANGFNCGSQMAWGNGHLWIMENTNVGVLGSVKVYEIDTVGGNVVQSWSVQSYSPYSSSGLPSRRGGLFYKTDATNGDELWINAYHPGSNYNLKVVSTSGALRRRVGYNISGTFASGVAIGSDGSLVLHMGASGTQNYGAIQKFMPPHREFLARSLLSADVVKTSAQTMKLTYQFDYV